MITKTVKEGFNSVFFEHLMQMSNDHHIDFSTVKTQNKSSFKMKVTETNFSFTANLGELKSISFSEEVLTFKFDKGYLRIEMTFDDICRYFQKIKKV